MRGPLKTTALLALLWGGVLLPGLALGSTEYPTEIESQLHLNYTPPCSYCHANGNNDAGTVTTPFGKTMVNFGLVGGNNIASLEGALAGLQGTNSVYITDLQNGVDPNAPTPITYGCFSAPGQGGPSGPAAVFVLALALLLVLRPRRRR